MVTSTMTGPGRHHLEIVVRTRALGRESARPDEQVVLLMFSRMLCRSLNKVVTLGGMTSSRYAGGRDDVKNRDAETRGHLGRVGPDSPQE